MFVVLGLDLIHEGLQSISSRDAITLTELLSRILEFLVKTVGNTHIVNPLQSQSLMLVGDESVEKGGNLDNVRRGTRDDSMEANVIGGENP